MNGPSPALRPSGDTARMREEGPRGRAGVQWLGILAGLFSCGVQWLGILAGLFSCGVLAWGGYVAG